MIVSALVRAGEQRGVSGWLHPVLSLPWSPVVLVEGEIDETVLLRVAAVFGSGEIKFTTVPGIDGREKCGGKEASSST